MFKEERLPGTEGMTFDPYNEERLKLCVAGFFSLATGVFFCIPIVIMALDFCSREVHVGLLLAFLPTWAVWVGWWLGGSPFTVGIIIAYAAILVNVNVGGQ